jgi:hypothetical protein
LSFAWCRAELDNANLYDPGVVRVHGSDKTTFVNLSRLVASVLHDRCTEDGSLSSSSEHAGALPHLTARKLNGDRW